MTYVPSPVLNESWYTGNFLVSEANGFQSREVGVFTNSSGTDIALPSGLIVAFVNNGNSTVTAGTNTGNGTMGTITLGGAVQAGAYVATLTSATAFTVVAPNGESMAAGTTGSVYSDAQINFTITAGGTAFVAGDKFTIEVDVGTFGYASWAGTGIPAGILFNRLFVPAGTTKKATVIARLAEVNTAELQWDAAVLAASNVATLKALARDALVDQSIMFR